MVTSTPKIKVMCYYVLELNHTKHNGNKTGTESTGFRCGASASGGAWDMYICSFTQKWFLGRIAKKESHIDTLVRRKNKWLN